MPVLTVLSRAALAVCIALGVQHVEVVAAPAVAETVADLRLRAYDSAYNLNYDEAIALLEEGVDRWPEDASLYRSLATMAWLQIVFARGSVTVDDYLGPLSKHYSGFRPPPPEMAKRFTGYARRAIALAEKRLAVAPDDLGAKYELGAAVGLLASYTATVEGRVYPALRAALRAYRLHEQILKAAPQRTEAGLIVGTYRYLCANLSWPLRWMARAVGFGASRGGGLHLIEAAARPPSAAQVEASFALVILYSRERRFDRALDVVRDLQARFPENRLLWLEGGAMALRAGRFEEAERDLAAGFGKLVRDSRPRVDGEEALWQYTRGAVRVALNRQQDALSDLNAVLTSGVRAWVKGRAHLQLAKVALQRGDSAAARQELDRAIPLCTADNDPLGAAEARGLREKLNDRE